MQLARCKIRDQIGARHKKCSTSNGRLVTTSNHRVLVNVSCLVSRFPFLVSRFSCLVSRVSCLVSRVSCLVFRVSCLVSRVSCFVARVSCFVFRVSCFVSRVSCFVFQDTSHPIVPMGRRNSPDWVCQFDPPSQGTLAYRSTRSSGERFPAIFQPTWIRHPSILGLRPTWPAY